MARGKTKTRKRVRLSVQEAPAPNVLQEGWVLGKTCLSCKTTYNVRPMPEFQDAGAKHGKYDVTKQLPRTAKDYPICEECLPWHWRVAARQYGMEKEVKEVYAGCFQ